MQRITPDGLAMNVGKRVGLDVAGQTGDRYVWIGELVQSPQGFAVNNRDPAYRNSMGANRVCRPWMIIRIPYSADGRTQYRDYKILPSKK